jgi:precorrin-6A/cobalt-precorrin-6A reductase
MIVNHGMCRNWEAVSAMPNVLLLGGTTEASALARLLSAEGIAATLSYAGRTESPRAQPVPVRVGGFGGVAGLADYLREARVTHLAWEPVPGDRWTRVPDIDGAVAALDGPARRIMLALGRMHVEAFAAEPQHHYLLRFVDTPERPPALPRHSLIVDRGPFTVTGDSGLMQRHAIDLVVCKNAGGQGAEAKLLAARQLGVPVLMIDRPAIPDRAEVYRPEDVLAWLGHDASPDAERGV